MNPRFRPLQWLLSTAMFLALPVALAYAQPEPDIDDEVPSDITDDADDDDDDDGDGDDDDSGDDSDSAKEAAPAAVGGLAGYDKGFFIQSPDGAFLLKTKLRFEGRLNFQIEEGADGKEISNVNFLTNRTRLTFVGKAFNELGYKFQLAWDKGDMVLKDAAVDYSLGEKLKLRTGLEKQPFSRQHIGSSADLSLVDRAITHAIGSRRDIGVMVHNDYTSSPELEWAVGLFNGQKADATVYTVDPVEGDVSLSNFPNKFYPSLTARVGINRGKDAKGKPLKGYIEGDLEGGPLRYGVAVSFVADLDLIDSDNQTRNIYAQLDYIVKVNGLSSTGGFYIHNNEDFDGLQRFGFHLQGSKLMADKHLLAARLAFVSIGPAVDGEDRINVIETAVGHSYIIKSHKYKWHTDLTILDPGAGSYGDYIGVRTQFEVGF